MRCGTCLDTGLFINEYGEEERCPDCLNYDKRKTLNGEPALDDILSDNEEN